MKITALDIPDIKLIEPVRHKDGRGFFSEVWNSKTLREAGIDLTFVQDNHSLSPEQGTLRGLHFQSPPFAQTKLVRVVRGSLLDVVVDIRLGSPTYGQSLGVELSADNWKQLLVPIGFAHGIYTLEDNTEILYKVTAHYSPECDHGILWSDHALDIDWPLNGKEPFLSPKDQKLPLLENLESPFRYEG